MNRRSFQKQSQLAARLRCLAVTLGVAFAVVGAALAAPPTGPVTNTSPFPATGASPAAPTPYQSPLFHSGGALTPGTTPFTAQPGQLQGTPTDLNLGGVPTQIPSFLLGDYDPLRPPAASGTYYPEHFADGDIYSWQAPFDYVPVAAGTVTVDDAQTVPVNGSVFAATAGFLNVTSAAGMSGDLTAATATNAEYDRLPPSAVGTATWTLKATAPGNFSVYFHIPDNITDSSGASEARSTGVDYTITVTGSAAQTVRVTTSQTDANSSQFLAGPFQLAVGDIVTVTLQRDATHNQQNAADYLIADSMTLRATIGDVQGTPTAINDTSFPADFQRAKYWGIYTPTSGPQAPIGTTAAQNAIPDTTGGLVPNTTPIFRSGATNANDPGNLNTVHADALHLIRQLVYFGRSEPTINNNVRVDNSDSAFTTPTGTWASVTDATATNGTYLHSAAVNGAASATAQWILTAPNIGNYYLSVHLPQGNTATETRITDATYTVTYGAPVTTLTVKSSQAPTGGADSTVLLPTGPLHLTKGETVTVVLNNTTAGALSAKTFVIADSISMTSGTGNGAIYCVDGFTGGVLWRFETPGSPLNGPSAPVFSAPAVAKINVMTSPGDPAHLPSPIAPTFANKLVVIVGDNNGMVYCLDAIGNGDGTSNANAIDTTSGQPIILPQPGYGTTPTQVDVAGYSPHVGTTSAYWIYRPDSRLPKDITSGKVKATPDPLSDLPVPASFGSASPTIFVDPTVTTTPTTAANSNAIVYVGNSNGVLYALNAIGVPFSATDLPGSATYPYGDTFNAALDLRNTPGVFPAAPTDAIVPTCQPLWWFTLRGANPAAAATSADIESAPAIYVAYTPPAAPALAKYTPTVYIGSAHEQESTSNIGRLYALNGLYGPSGNGGKSDPRLAAGAPGTAMYNVDQRPTLPTVAGVPDTADWTFPDRYGTQPATINASQKPRPALGNITGSPVVFTNFHETAAPANRTRIYFAANVGIEIPAGSALGTAASARPDDTATGRIWAVNLDGSVGTTTDTSGVNAHPWAYPLANNPNDATKDAKAEPFAPIGAFLHMTPAIGYVQFPATINPGTGTYAPVDQVATGGLLGQSIPMLYFGTRGAEDTQLYAVDIDGDMNPALAVTSPNYDQRTIYHVISPDGAIFQSSPILITNATLTGGNGGSLLVVAGDTLYDYSATPISNPDTTQAFPLIREDRAFVGFGPLSSPAVSAADVSDLTGATFTTYGGANVTDWVYVGDSSTGLCRGITPNDPTYTGIPTDLGDIVPPSVDAPVVQDLTSIIQTYLVDDTHAGSTKAAAGADALKIGVDAPLPVYEWGQNVYIRFSNVVPPNPASALHPLGDPALYVHDKSVNLGTASASNPITFYTNPGNGITFNLSDITAGEFGDKTTIVDSGTVPPATVTALPADGFIARTDTDTTTNLVDGNNLRWIGAYTYAISDGSARRNTPGGRRRVQDASQTVSIRYYIGGALTADASYTLPTTTATTAILRGTATNGNVVSAPIRNGSGTITGYGPPVPVGAVDQPTFGILNPIGVRGGGIPLSLTTGTPTYAVQIGDELGPFRGTSGTVPIKNALGVITGGDAYALEALAHGNDTYQGYAPPSSSGVGVSPITLSAPGSSFTPPVLTQVVVTSTGLIPHNSSGDNADSAALPAPPSATFATNGTSDQGVPPTAAFGSADRPYALDIFDRSPLGLVRDANGLPLKTLKLKMGITLNGGREGLAWNDNRAAVSLTGHDAVVNFLPWETPPTSYNNGGNTSPDYPDIAPQNITATLHADDNAGGSTAILSSDSAVATPAQAGSTLATAVQNRMVFANPVQIHVDVPIYQPANQQLYSKGSGQVGYSATGEIAPLTPAGVNAISAANDVFPMGYVTTKRIYVPNQYGRYDSSTAYRDVRIYTGVPISMATSMADGTVDVGKTPHGYGIQTQDYAALNLFTPYSPAFQTANFLPLTIHNDGNVNLLNVHLDQKQFFNGVDHVLTLTSDSLDPLSIIPGYDNTGFTGVLNGATGGRKDAAGLDVNIPGTTVPEFPYLVRSSLDTDLVAAYGRNPGILADATWTKQYPCATFHKALPGSAAPTTLYVPDAPDTTLFSLTHTNKPTAAPPGSNALPFVGVAIPFGAPVGTYHQTLRVFEGMDTTGYNTYNNPSTDYNPYYPPQYGGAVGGQGMPALGTYGYPTDRFQYGLQPVSDPGVTLRATVLEDRLTDGFTFGALPQIDLGPASTVTAGQSTPDFAPAAFRDPGGNLSLYWTSGRGTGFGIYGENVNFTSLAFLAATTGQNWWSPVNVSALTSTGTNSGLTIAQDVTDPTNVYGFAVNVSTPPYANTIYSYSVAHDTGIISTPQAVTSDPAQVKYGVRGLYTKSGFAGTIPNLWAFWTASTRGRTAIYYNSRSAGTGNWPQATYLLPVPAGLTAVADPAPLLLTAPVIATGGGFGSAPVTEPVIEVTFSGTAPDGNTDLYECRYAPDNTNVAQLNLVSFPTVTEQMTPPAGNGWYQSRDVAWSRTGALNLTLMTPAGVATPILYDTTGKPLFGKAVFDKASGLLVLTGVSFSGAATGGTVTIYIDGATGRVRFTQPPPAGNVVTATFNPLARRLTTDLRSDVGPVTFLDPTFKLNDGFGLNNVETDRRWYVWRESGASGDAHSATLYHKTQRLTMFLPNAIGVSIPTAPATPTLLLTSVKINGTDITPYVDVDYTRGRIYFPILAGGTFTEGQTATVTYAPQNTVTSIKPNGTPTTVTETIQWQDEQRANDSSTAPTSSIAGLATILDYAVPIDTIVNESNVSAFLDTDAYLNTSASVQYPHKVWLFWNSTRNGTADLYYETIDPRFSAGP